MKNCESCFFSSSIGQKAIMALTGLLLLGFVLAHLTGNLQVFLGQDTFNAYAAFLKSMPAVLWGARLGLLAVFGLHIKSAISLWKLNSAARPVDYSYQNTVQASPASRYMLHTGLLVLVFVLFHLLHFTLGYVQPEYAHLLDGQERHDVYSMLIYGFQFKPYAVGYIICMSMLGLHLSHGISSVFQTLGFNHPSYTPLIKNAATLIGTLVALGYISIPLAVLIGKLTLPGGG